MDPISNVDRVVLILRQRLQERARAAASKNVTLAGDAQKTPLEVVQSLAVAEGLGDRELGRALVQSLLTDHFGRDLVNDAKFQRVVDRVTETLEADPTSAQLLADTVRQLRASAR